MSVLIVTSLGDLVLDLFVEKCPLTTKNFLKLCKIKYYNGCLFHTVQKDFTAQTGDPTGTGTGGDSVYKFLYGEQARFFGDEIRVDLKHSKTGIVAMASAGEDLNASQFYITLREDLDYLDGKHTVFGEVAEGLDTLTRINEAYVDEKNRPYKNIRIKHTYILEDPFEDPSQLAELIPDSSPEGKPKDEIDDEVRLEDDWVPLDEQLDPVQLEEVLREKDAHSSAVVLESIGDIPDADIKPPENVLFVCKLNPVTEDEDLHTIFSRFGTVTSAEIIRDYKTGDSLCYAFIEFEEQEACEQAYTKMDNALIDDRRIHVDFSQSVSKLWNQYRRRNNQPGKERGCFKCGALDHIAKDCTGQQAPKYILKEDNRQHGGYSDSRYEMVFDGDTPENPRQEKRHRGHDPDDQMEKSKMNRQSYERKDRDQEKKELRDRHRESDRSRDHRDDHKRNQEHLEERRAKEKHGERQGDRNYPRRDERAYRKSSDNTDRHRDRRDDSQSKRSDNRDYRKRNAEIDDFGDRRDDGDYRKRNDVGDIREDRRERQDTRKEQSYRKDNGDEDSYKRRDNRHVVTDSNGDHNRHRRDGSKDDHRRDRGDKRS
ncbi:peptidyl-prolyl cis-trans isomerase CYP59-like [Mangifera indica]|uniref:peptidyl-prolyl cis-trans isomerase CYP59-like n=1 Tax=Mangifera indica TaxID=29780 RepID=UPI001CFB8E2F|nr:peptidyl-prolyl cis-trans isomerase CYP59-like [Mangifera indica]